MEKTIILESPNQLILKAKILFILFIVLCCTRLNAQCIRYIDRNEQTEALFDDDNPHSLVSLLRANERYLGYFAPQGIVDSVLEEFSIAERNELLEMCRSNYDYFVTEEDRLILEDDEYVKDGSEFFYETRIIYDTIYLDLTNIARIVLTDSLSKYYDDDTVQYIEFWKVRNGELYRAAAFESEELLSLEGFNRIFPLDEQWSSKIMDGESPYFNWQQQRDSSLRNMAVYDLYWGGGREALHYFFPSTYSYTFNYSFNVSSALSPPVVERAFLNEEMHHFHPCSYAINELPFSYELGDSVWNNYDYVKELNSVFDSVFYLMIESYYPLYTVDGYDSVIMNEQGEWLTVYAPPEPYFFWLDYEPVIYASESIVRDSTGVLRSALTDLYFAIDLGREKPALVSEFSIRAKDPSFTAAYPSFNLQDMEWHRILMREKANTINCLDPASLKDQKALEKRNKALLKGK